MTCHKNLAKNLYQKWWINPRPKLTLRKVKNPKQAVKSKKIAYKIILIIINKICKLKQTFWSKTSIFHLPKFFPIANMTKTAMIQKRKKKIHLNSILNNNKRLPQKRKMNKLRNPSKPSFKKIQVATKTKNEFINKIMRNSLSRLEMNKLEKTLMQQ